MPRTVRGPTLLASPPGSQNSALLLGKSAWAAQREPKPGSNVLLPSGRFGDPPRQIRTSSTSSPRRVVGGGVQPIPQGPQSSAGNGPWEQSPGQALSLARCAPHQNQARPSVLPTLPRFPPAPFPPVALPTIELVAPAGHLAHGALVLGGRRGAAGQTHGLHEGGREGAGAVRALLQAQQG